MPNREVTIKAIDAVRCIRSGMDDAALMQEFNVNARGLQSLFTQLIAAGILRRSELEERLSLSYASVIVDVELAQLPPPRSAKPRIDAAEALNYLRSGMDDAALMKKYDLSIRGLQSLFNKLAAAGLITETQLSERTSTGEMSVSVDEGLFKDSVAHVAAPRIDPTRVLSHIRSGLDREALLKEYRITAGELQSLLRDMVTADLISRTELAERLPPRQTQLEIRHRFTNKIIYNAPAPSLGALVESAVSWGIDLSHADLAGVNLPRADLSCAQLSGANFAKAILVGTDFTGAKLAGATLASADMHGAILCKANLAGANLSDANMTMANGSWAFLAGADLSETNLTNANFTGANLGEANLFGTILRGTDFTGAYLIGTELDSTKNKKK
ncbi:MAG: pentapeptide repeat-containing protein [Desulfomonilaceae bacterium]